MRDLELFRRLRDGTITPDLAPDLAEVGTWPLAQRGAILGVLQPALRAAEPALRAAAVTALGGVQGRQGLIEVVRALDDDAASVRAAAIEALRRTALEVQPWRIVHALLHRRPEVRRAALQGALPTVDGLASVICALVADPAARDLVAGARVGAEVLPTVFAFLAEGVIPPDQARPMIAELPLQALLPWWQADDGNLEAWLELFWVDDPSTARVLRGLRRALLADAPEALRQTVAAHVAAVATSRGALPDPLAALVVALSPEVLAEAWLPESATDAGWAVLHEDRDVIPELPADRARKILTSPRVRSGAQLSPWRLAAVLGLVRGPIPLLFQVHGPGAIVEVFRTQPREASHLLALPVARGASGHAYLVRLIGQELPTQLPRLLAWSLVHRPTTVLDQLARTPGAVILPVLDALVDVLTGADEAEPPRLPPPVPVQLAEVVATELLPRLRVRHWPIVGLQPYPLRVLSFLRLLCRRPHPVMWPILAELTDRLGPSVLAHVLDGLRPHEIRAVLDVLRRAPHVPPSAELPLRQHFADHPDARVREWCTPGPQPLARARTAAASPLDAAAHARVASALPSALDEAVAPWRHTASDGLAGLLARRPPPAAPSVAVCVAVLGSDDLPADVAAQFERYRGPLDDAAWWAAFDREMVEAYRTREALPLLAHAWLWRWPRHARALVEGLTRPELAAGLRELRTLGSVPLAREGWLGVASALRHWRYLGPGVLASLTTPDLVDCLVEHADTEEFGVASARALGAIGASGVAPELLAAARRQLLPRLARLSGPVRFELGELLDSGGVSPSGRPRAVGAGLSAGAAAALAEATDPAWLASLVARGDKAPALATEAILRLTELEEPGAAALEALLWRQPRIRHWREALCESITLWPEGPSVRAVQAGVPGLPPEDRFGVALALAQRGGEHADHWLEVCLQAAVEAPPGVAQTTDWGALTALRPPLEIARAVVTAADPALYVPAVDLLLDATERVETTEALVRFLEVDHDRYQGLRERVAGALRARFDDRGFPLLLAGTLEGRDGAERWPWSEQGLLDVAVAAVSRLGGDAERGLLQQLGRGVPRGVEVPWTELLRRLSLPEARSTAAARATDRASRTRRRKLEDIVETFAWGVRRGYELLGRRYRVHMTAGPGELGHTRLSGRSIHVSPLPLLQGERHGAAIVEGLILHELGHHRYHRGGGAAAVWKEAEDEGMFPLLNLVADEHLERNLRAYDGDFGDRLKALAAYAFQHSPRELEVRSLPAMLGPWMFAVLTGVKLEVAWDPSRVRVSSGRLLAALEARGHSFARFVRALRMGLGNRHRDPKVAEALALFKQAPGEEAPFRQSSMEQLFVIAKEVRRIFGAEASLAGQLAGLENVEGALRDQDVHGEQIQDREVQREIERITAPPRPSGQLGRLGRPGRLQVNVGADESFQEIEHVQPVPWDADAARALGQDVARHARRMRRRFEELGLRLEPVRRRLRGSRFDRTRAKAMVLRRDPRVLVSRELQIRTDLFLGVTVDCSGSMSSGGSMDKAKRFAALLAEAARGLKGVDLRVIGFTDRTLYDAGDAERCAVAGLYSHGGNNDAAGLAHLARLAHASPRRAKVLVMVSDGLPTECSTNALRGLVRRLERQHLIVAQVAVQPLSERCFTHYVEIDDDTLDAAVGRFGQIVTRLVHRALRP